MTRLSGQLATLIWQVSPVPLSRGQVTAIADGLLADDGLYANGLALMDAHRLAAAFMSFAAMDEPAAFRAANDTLGATGHGFPRIPSRTDR